MQDNVILGSIGHIDHGKTSLIAALNGFWGDEREDEQKRGITLDLSFSNLSNGIKNIAFIDVPGHERLVKNMIAGAFGIDYALLVIASNEGIKPQTLEHLKITYLLGIKEFLVILTKTDLASKNTIAAIKLQIKELFSHYNLNYSIFECSIYDNASIQALKEALFLLPKKLHRDLGCFRYYIDRAFAIKGSGCVVSGTLLDGNLNVEQKIWCCNLQKSLGIKNIQSHNAFIKEAKSGQRIAINLAGISHNALKRGYLLTKKGYLRGFNAVEVCLDLHENITHNSEVLVFIGSLKCKGKVLFLKNHPKYATLKCDRAIFSAFGERFILRDENKTLGGGKILSPIGDPMKKKQKLAFLESLDKEDFKTAFSILLSAHKKGFGLISTMQRFGIPQSEAINIASEIQDCFVSTKHLVAYGKQTEQILEKIIHNILDKNPNALLSPALLSQKHAWIVEDFAKMVLETMHQRGLLNKEESFYISLSFKENIQDYLYKSIYETLQMQGFEPIAPYNLYESLDIDRATGNLVLKQLTREKKVIRLNHKLFISAQSLSQLLALMRKILQDEGYLELNNLKNHLNLSRKYLITYLDYLDSFSDIINKEGRRFKKDQLC
ncbi:selenocysteine-specific translation elongation factor [Helicobacter apodemus]|uniref:Selenocysteine-specific translation elongation factor n=1 Tax=Helicobacter apodemus TaxID=135569 RepID=A0A4U8UD98_9HELI|nr:selenocysteine-specific translation elongation factor [Helicobacter apodemus]TLE15599.1 selenocysteine-specific translation elongation factor [Helicobacter apodemus]